MKLRKMTVGLIVTTALCSQAALASIYPGNVSIVDTEINYPEENILKVNYRMFGSEIFNTGNTVDFALTQDGGSSGISIGRGTAGVSCGSGGLGGTMRCVPSNTQQTYTVNLDSVLSEQNKNALATTCTPYEFQVKATYSVMHDLSMNTVKIGPKNPPVDWGFDFDGTGIYPPNQVTAGSKLNFQATVITNLCQQNSGSAPTLAVFLADENMQLTNYFGEVPVGLPYGSVHNLAITVPSELAPGTYYLVLVIDRNNVVAESNENNNVASGKITVIDGAVTEIVSTPSGLSANNSDSIIELSGTIEDNQNFVEPQLPVTPGMKVLKSSELKKDDAINLNTPHTISLSDQQE